jgi:hypothetical protein
VIRGSLEISTPHPLLVLGDPTILESLVNNIVLNVDKHSPKPENLALFPSTPIDVSCRLVDNMYFELTVANPNNDSDAERKFLTGRAHRMLSLELHKYEGQYRGYIRGDKFLTEVQLRAV